MSWIGGRAARARKRLRAMASEKRNDRAGGEWHSGMFNLSAPAPNYWNGPLEYQPNSALSLSGDFLSEDFCVIGGEYFFIRGVLMMPVKRMDVVFGVDAWSSISLINLESYLEGYHSGRYSGAGPWFGWFSNNVPGFPGAFERKCQIMPRNDRMRPVLTILDEDHELGRIPKKGVSAARIWDMLEENGHVSDQPEG